MIGSSSLDDSDSESDPPAKKRDIIYVLVPKICRERMRFIEVRDGEKMPKCL